MKRTASLIHHEGTAPAVPSLRKDSMKRKIQAASFALLLFLTSCSDSLNSRVAQAISHLPAIARVVAPNSPRIACLDSAVTAFNNFKKNGTVFNWENAMGIWNNCAKPELAKLNDGRLKDIVAQVDKLSTQVTLPVGVAGSGGGADTTSNKVLVRFEEDDVEELEKLIESVK